MKRAKRWLAPKIDYVIFITHTSDENSNTTNERVSQDLKREVNNTVYAENRKLLILSNSNYEKKGEMLFCLVAIVVFS